MKVIGSDKRIYTFSPLNKPQAFIDLGETFWIETEDCYGGQIQTEHDLRTHIDTSTMDASTGPIAVNGVFQGDVIRVEILDIQVADKGIMVTAPGLGPLGDMIAEATTKIIPIEDGLARFNDRICFPIKPMIGVIGVAPREGSVHCATPGDHGGNLDTKDITIKSSVYFPVFVDGANLAVGDLHARMGDGELDGTGIEVAGKIKMRVSKVKCAVSLTMPIVETDEEYLVIASEQSFSAAARKGIACAVKLLEKSLELSFSDAYRLVSATCDLRVSQIVNPLITVRVAIPKSLTPPLFWT